ncbi:isochorismatase family protein [Candidatus Falkowbacteria bacterium]|nr:isochorismatase family protein [Candidatus Falkowbacteria bacterium]
MLNLDAARSGLLVIDLQARLMPAIAQGATVALNARRLLTAARRLDVPVLFTEQNPRGLGATLPELAPAAAETAHKMTFDALRAPGIANRLDPSRAMVVAGCEAHVCVLQTVLGLRARNRPVYVVADAVGSRSPENHRAALERMARHGAEVVTTEMVLFEWLGSADHPAFREIVALIK